MNHRAALDKVYFYLFGKSHRKYLRCFKFLVDFQEQNYYTFLVESAS